jgi:hypothetical protein
VEVLHRALQRLKPNLLAHAREVALKGMESHRAVLEPDRYAESPVRAFGNCQRSCVLIAEDVSLILADFHADTSNTLASVAQHLYTREGTV